MSELHPPGKLGLIGAGGFGRFCLAAYRSAPDLVVVAVADPDPRALGQVNLPNARLETDWRAVVEVPEIEVIHLVTPPYLRRPMVEAAIAAGKSVFCEKPPALSLEELDAMLVAASDRNVAFGVDYVMRRVPAYRLLQAAVDSGILGAPRTLSFVNLAQQVPSGHWFWDRERSGGIFVEHGIHFFDIFGRIFGTARSVSAVTPHPELALAIVEYAAPGLGTYHHEFAYPQAVEQTQAVLGFERGTVTLEGWIPTRLEAKVLDGADDLREIARSVGAAAKVQDADAGSFTAVFPDRQLQYQAAIVAGMRDTLRRHRDPEHRMAITPGQIRDSLALALAAQDAADSGHVVTLS